MAIVTAYPESVVLVRPPAADQHRVEGDQGPGQRRCPQPPPPAGELGFIPVRRGRTRPAVHHQP
ncbi:MAG TPA: hypothetical protein VIJ13_04365, partial [Actinomycetota bacterium]